MSARQRGMRRVRRGAAVACVAALAWTGTAGQALGSPAGEPTGPRVPGAAQPGDHASRGGSSSHAVTLITGDVVRVRSLPRGRRTVSVSPGPGRADVGFHRFTRDGDVFVVPADAMPYVASGRVDEALFNVTGLVRKGYGDTKRDSLPLIVTYGGTSTMRSAQPMAGANRTATLESINGHAVAAEKDRAGAFWRSVRAQPAASGSAGTASPQLAHGAKRVWLDARVHASLQQSTRQIGAPAAWQKGLTGNGATVAVLDTGVDATHPDLQDQVKTAKNFTPTKTTTDRFGHGTHVASIAAGTGAASAGSQQGVAHGADLVVGKVLDNSGFGQLSWIIDGMEWAAARAGADVVNMSLGGAPTEGTDPLSIAVNQLTATTGTLFAVAAGNAGPAPRTVGSPGTASSALTVGAVNADDQLAPFSSRGPRLGDFAIKPDVTAPGVDIAAARASGTNLGEPMGKYYTRLSGTSMATPHVAGAAAILAAQHPKWEAPQLKAALMNSAVPTPGASVYGQGAGRVDVARAVSQRVIAQPGSVSLGYFRYPHGDDEPATRDVTYTNTSDQPVTLDLALNVRSKDGTAPPAGMLQLSTSSLRIPAGASRTVTVIVDTRVGAVGLYGGVLTARRTGTSDAASAVTRTPVGFYKEPEMYDLTIRGIGRDGKPAMGIAEIFGVDEQYERQSLKEFTGKGVVTFRVPPGTYNVMSYLYETGKQGGLNSLALVGEPQVEVTGNSTVTLDGRDANPIRVDTPRASRPKSGTIAYHRASGERSFTSSFSVSGATARSLYAAPTEKVTEGDFEFYSAFRRTPPAGQASTGSAAGRPYLYDLMLPEPDRVPEDLTYQVKGDDLARVNNHFYSQGKQRTGGEARFGFRPYSLVGFAMIFELHYPGRRTEWVSAGDTRWSQLVLRQYDGFAGQQETLRSYRPDQHKQQSWFKQVVRPGTNPAQGGASYRNGDTLTIDVASFRDAAADHYGYAAPGDTTRGRLYRDGELVADRNTTYGTFPVAPEPATYRFVTDISRDKKWWTMSTRTHTEWQFPSQRPEAGRTVLPLLNLRYGLNLDQRNRAPAGEPFTINLHASHQPGATTPSITNAKLSVSYNDGQSWTPVDLDQRGDGTYQARITHPGKDKTSGYVSLRAQVRDADGNRIDQTITRAYQLRSGS